MEPLAFCKFHRSVKIHKSEITPKQEGFEIFRQTKSNKCPLFETSLSAQCEILDYLKEISVYSNRENSWEVSPSRNLLELALMSMKDSPPWHTQIIQFKSLKLSCFPWNRPPFTLNCDIRFVRLILQDLYKGKCKRVKMKLFTVDFRDLHSVCAYVYERERARCGADWFLFENEWMWLIVSLWLTLTSHAYINEYNCKATNFKCFH